MTATANIPNPCYVLRHPHGNQSRRVAEGLLVFSSPGKAEEHVENFFPVGESAHIMAYDVEDLRSSYTSIVIDHVTDGEPLVVVDISNGTGELQNVIGF